MCYHVHLIFSKPKVFSKSSGLMLASHAISHGCFVVRVLFSTASSRASFLDYHPSECQKQTEKIRSPTLTFTQAWAILPSFPSIAPSSAPTTAPRLLSTATKTSPDVCLRSSSPAISLVTLAALAANLHPSVASMLNCYSISSFINQCSIPKKTSKGPLYLLVYFLSVLQAKPFSIAHLDLFSSLLISVRSTPVDRFHSLCSRKCLPPHPTRQ